MTQNELDKILKLHEKWLYGEKDGRRANLIDANLTGANLSYANLTSANLSYAYLTDANLTSANLKGVYADENTAFFHLQCPEEGSYIAYKKCQEDMIVKLLIPEDAKRSSATTRKCRASKAKVLSITNINGTENFDIAFSCYDRYFIYKVGKTIEIKDFDEDRWNECGAGIHHFITRKEAVDYNF